MSLIASILKPESIAIVGASADPTKLTGRPIAYLRRHAYAGRIYPVNPRAEAIGDLKCYPSPADLPEGPDLALVLVGANRVMDAVRGLAAVGTKAAIVLASGFGESGPEGRNRQEALREAAKRPEGTSMRLLGPNTIGLVNLTDGIMLTASGAMELEEFHHGGIALLSQSGGILGSLLSRAMARGIGFSKLVGTGNEADLTVADFLAELADDPDTRVVALYLETIRDVASFRAAAQRVIAAGKKIVAYKVGRSEHGQRAAVSHTGALAGAAEAFDALFEQLGIIRAHSFNELLDIPAALTSGRVLRGNRVAILTSTGGAGTIVADTLGLSGLDVPAPDPETAAQLQALDLPDAALDRNPIDTTMAGLRGDLFRQIIGILIDSPSYDAILVVAGSSAIVQPDLAAGPMREALARTDKPLMGYVSPDAPNVVKHMNRSGIPAFATPESCAPALLSLRPVSPPPVVPDLPHAAGGNDDLKHGSYNEAESMALFARFGIPIPREATATSPEEAARAAAGFGGPVVVKILSDEILHKSEVGGVAVGVPANEVAARCAAMHDTVRAATSARIDGFLIQELIQDSVELILGFTRDPQLGPCILLGAGGVNTELYRDVSLRVLPIDRAQAAGMAQALSCAPLLHGFRGRPIADSNALTDAVMAFAGMIATIGDRLQEAEINPLFVLPEGQGIRAGDGLVVLE